MTPSSSRNDHSDHLTYFVEGMDCASCVQTVERMVATLPGTSDVKTSFTKQTLTLHLDEGQTPRGLLEKNLKSLGYVPALLGSAAPAGSQLHNHPDGEHEIGRAHV